jgi:hypothetical protein
MHSPERCKGPYPHLEDAGRGVDGVVANQCLMDTLGFAEGYYIRVFKRPVLGSGHGADRSQAWNHTLRASPLILAVLGEGG